jgi:hypothetical protein
MFASKTRKPGETNLVKRIQVEPNTIFYQDSRGFLTAAANLRIDEENRATLRKDQSKQAYDQFSSAAFINRASVLTKKPNQFRERFALTESNPTSELRQFKVKRTTYSSLHDPSPSTKPSIDPHRLDDKNKITGSSNLELNFGDEIFDDNGGSVGKELTTATVVATADNIGGVKLIAFPDTEEFIVFYGEEQSKKTLKSVILRHGKHTLEGLTGRPHTFVIGSRTQTDKIDFNRRYQVHSATPMSFGSEILREPSNDYNGSRRF